MGLIRSENSILPEIETDHSPSPSERDKLFGKHNINQIEKKHDTYINLTSLVVCIIFSVSHLFAFLTCFLITQFEIFQK